MMTMRFKLPYAFLMENTDLSWSDIEFGLEHMLISPSIAIEHAASDLLHSTNPLPEETDLAGRSDADPVLEIVSTLAAREVDRDDNLTREKWLFLVLAWLYECRQHLAEPLAAVEQVYSDFDYPNAIASFVRYMPMHGPDLGTPEANAARLFKHWEDYLRICRKRFAPSDSRDKGQHF